MQKGRKWVVVADGGSAQVYALDRETGALAAVADVSMERDTQQSGEIMADRPGRSFDSHGSGRHAMEPRTPADKVAEHTFLRQLAHRLEVAAVKGRFTELVLVAAPHALGELRGLLNAHITRAITAELAKNLTHESPSELRAHLADSL